MTMERKMFLSAACFNWLVAVALVVNVGLLFGVFHVEPVPENRLFVHFFSALVFSFGIGYYWIANDILANRPLIHIGAVGKLVLVCVGVLDVALGIVSWQILILLSVDLVYSLLFFKVLRQLPRD
jgi:hypothetical protein